MTCIHCGKDLDLKTIFSEFAELWEDAQEWAMGAVYCTSCEKPVGQLVLDCGDEAEEELRELNQIATENFDPDKVVN